MNKPLKSSSVPVVPTTDPTAPYGRDDSGNPLRIMRSDVEIAKTIDIKPGLCPHKSVPEECIQCRKKPLPMRGPDPDQSLTNQAKHVYGPQTVEEREKAAVASVQGALGLQTPMPSRRVLSAASQLDDLLAGKKVSTEYQESAPSLQCDCLREILMLEREDIVNIFGVTIGHRVLVKPDGNLEQLQMEIKELRQRLLTRSAAWQKAHRPDDILPRNDRERLKRDETLELTQKVEELKNLKARLQRWNETPRIPITFGRKHPITYQDVVVTSEFINDVRRTPAGQDPYFTEILSKVEEDIGDEYNLEGYKKFLALSQAGDTTPTGWIRWENLVILQAIKCGLIKPNVALVRDYPSLAVYEPTPDHEADDPENALTLQTGGATINGRIRGEGWRGNKLRPLSGFDKPRLKTLGQPVFDGDSYIPDLGDDSESYNPN